MAKHLVLLLIAVVILARIEALSFGECPLSSKMASCSPRCEKDNECVSGEKCCPNQCNTKSCVYPKAGTQGVSNGVYKGSSATTATGQYCGNVKCNAYEKCAMNKSTKRQECVRS